MKITILIASLFVSFSALAVTPESGAVGRLEGVVANIKNAEVDRTVTADLNLLLRVADRFAETYADDFAAFVADQQNPTAAERAGFVLLKIKQYAQGVVKKRAEVNQRVIEDAPITTAGSTASADLD